MLTLKQIVKKLEELALSHLQVNSFHFGPPDEIEESGSLLFPLMGADLQPGTITRRIQSTKILLYFGDLVHVDYSNRTEVLSDMQRVALGILAQFKDYLNLNNVELVSDGTLSEFIGNWDSNVSGYQTEITINQFYAADACQEPSTFVPSAEGSGSVRIYNLETGVTIDTRNPGEDYPVLEFSGISGGEPDTVFTNSIVGGVP